LEEKTKITYKHRGFKYRIYPTEDQCISFTKTFGCVRFVYNNLLDKQQKAHNAGEKLAGKIGLDNHCTRVLKKEYPWLCEVDKFALSNSAFALATAYSNFFNRSLKAEKPKFKSRKTSRMSYSTNITNNNIAIVDTQIKLPKLGMVKAKLHRPLPRGAIIKGATVSKTACGHYYCVLKLAIPATPVPATKPTIERTLGIDYSSHDFAVFSDGSYATPPHALRMMEARLAKEQRRLSRKTRGSSNKEKQRRKVAAVHEKVANQRKDFCHKLSREIANSYDAVCVEDLDLRNLSRTLRLGKATADNGFGMFRTFLGYKLEDKGKLLIKINKWFPSSKLCHCCGYINNELMLKDRTWTCAGCGTKHDRDVNAAINIRNEGFAIQKAM